MKQILGVIIAVLVFASFSFAQQIPVNNINIDQLSDQQLVQLLGIESGSGISDEELAAKAKEKGLSPDQVQKIRKRIPVAGNSSNNPTNTNDTKLRSGGQNISPKSVADSVYGLIIYGSDIFSKENLTFEPNLNIATPKNYIIGAGDELKIDVYGYSDKSQSLKVTPDGFIRYPIVGPIKVAGLSFTEAQKRIALSLHKVYPGIATGITEIQVSLGQIRSIRVNLIGEIKKPGTYTLPSLATIANALFVSGGPTIIGSYRNIELIRNGKSVSHFDLYNYLLKGDLSANLVLQDDDVIRVAPYSARVAVNGAVKRKAVYEITSQDKLSNVLDYAGGLSDNANKSFLSIRRFSTNRNEIFTVKPEQYKTFSMQSGDNLYVDSITNIFKNRIIIKGAVSYQGSYNLEDFRNLKDLLELVVIKEGAYKERAVISRKKSNYQPELIDFNINDILDGKKIVGLQREDSIYIYALKDIIEPFTIEVKGEVNQPGTFNFSEHIRIQDAILMAGGFKDGASQNVLELARRLRNVNSLKDSTVFTIIKQINLHSDSSETALFSELEPFDIVTVRKAPGYREQISVSAEGELMFPGKYVISNNQERLSDLIKRAGGLKVAAFPEGAFLLRKTFEGLTENDSVLIKYKNSTLKKLSNDTSTLNKSDSSFKSDLKMVGIRLEKVIENPGSIYDIYLQDGDILKVPQKLQTVQSFIGVYFPKKIVYREHMTVKDIVRESGGKLPEGKLTKSYVVYANGEVKSTKHFLFFSNFPTVKSGSEVYVPLKKEKRSMGVGEIAALATSVVTLLLLIKSL